MAIDVLGELIRTLRGHQYILIITERFPKLVRTITQKRITALTVAKAFVTYKVFVYGPPVPLLSDNSLQFTSKFFQNS